LHFCEPRWRNSAPISSAIAWAIEVLPTPGGAKNRNEQGMDSPQTLFLIRASMAEYRLLSKCYLWEFTAALVWGKWIGCGAESHLRNRRLNGHWLSVRVPVNAQYCQITNP
jgi:hypothetical protein